MPQSQPIPPLPQAGILHLPDVDPSDARELLDRLLAALEGVADAAPTVPSHGEAFATIVPFIETLLDDSPEEVSPTVHAYLVAIAMLPFIAEAIALQIAFGRSVGDQLVLKVARLIARARQRDLSVDDFVEQLAETDDVPRDVTFRLFRGESRRVPDQERVRRGIALLRRTAALAPEPWRPDLLCVLAWLHWARGQRAIAMTYLSEALSINPEHILAYGFSTIVTSSKPAWIEKQASISPTPAAASIELTRKGDAE